MKTVEAHEFAADMNRHLRDSRSEDILITQAGRPCAVLHGLDYDDEQLHLAESQEFWSMIRRRSNGAVPSWEDAKKTLGGNKH